MTTRELIISCIPGIIAGIVSGIFGGGILGPSVSNFLTGRRERKSGIESRKRELLEFLEEWRADIEGVQLNGPNPVVTDAYMAKRGKFMALSTSSADCFSDKAAFDKLVFLMGNINVSILAPQQDRGREMVLANLRPLIDFVKSN